MTLLNTDMFSLLTGGHPTAAARFAAARDEVRITIITRVEALEGRFAFLKKAANGAQVLRPQEWLLRTESDLARFFAVPFDGAAAAEFDRLRENKKLRRIGRADLLIAAIALANRATLVTRNVKDFAKVPGLRVENWVD